MGILDRFRIDEYDDDDATIHEDIISNVTVENAGSEAEPLDEFEVSEVASQSVKGREIHFEADNGEMYAGKWVREMMENAQRNPTQPTWIGYEEARNPLDGVKEVSVMHDELTSHMGVFGASGNGKSTLLVNMLVQWAYSGFGFCFIDPKGQDSYKLIQKLPEDRLDDVYWIEPGSIDHDKVVGLNFLDTHSDRGDPNFDNEVGQVINDLIPILKDQQNSWGARMQSIVENITRRMLEDNKNYSILDLYYLLNDPEYRGKLDQYYDPEEQFTLKQKAETIANYDQDDIEPVLRRFQTLAESRSTREVIAHKESDIDVHDIVNNNKIIILRASEADDSVQQIVATTIMRKIWSVISQRSKSEENDPYFLVADEFHKLTDSANNIDEMLSTGRSLGLSVTLSTQQPRQLGDLKEILGNVKNFITFNPGARDDAKFLAGKLMTDDDSLMGLPKYMGYANVGIGNQETSGPVRTHMFAPYPPRRDQEEAEDIVARIVEEHGKPPMLEKEIADFDEHPLARTATNKDGSAAKTAGGGSYTVTDEDHEITEEALLKCIFDAQLVNGGQDAWVTKDDVAKQIGQFLDYDISDDYGAKLSNSFERMPKRFIERQETDEVEFRLSDEGRDVVFVTDSGESGSAGFEKHRKMLEDAYIHFGRLGYDVDVLKQEGEMADGLAVPPINPDNAETYTEAQDLDEKLEEEYPELYNKFGPSTLHLEAEGATLEKPKQVFKNLRKALEANRKCVFIVRDGMVDGNDMDHNARKIESWIEQQNFAKKVDQGNRVFYNYNKLFTFEDGAVAARPDDGENSKWREDGEDIILESPSHVDEPYVRFENPEAVKDYSKNDFPYYYIRDNSNNVTRLYNTQGSGTTLEETYADKEEMKDDGFRPIPQPFIPEIDIPGWEEHNGVRDKDYAIVIIPANASPAASKGPQIYKDGKMEPLLNSDDKSVSYTTSAGPSDPFGKGDEDDRDKTSEEESEEFDEIDKVITEEAEESEVEVRDNRDHGPDKEETKEDEDNLSETDETDSDESKSDDDDDDDPDAPWL